MAPPALQRHLPRRHVARLYRDTAILLRAGVPLPRALEALEHAADGDRLRWVARGLQADLAAGAPLSSAMRSQPSVFPAADTGIIRAGEATGDLARSLERLAESVGRDLALRRQVVGVLAYPCTVAVAATGLTLFLISFVAPRMAAVWQEIGMPLESFPPLTLAVMGLSGAVATLWRAMFALGLLWLVYRRLFSGSPAAVRVEAAIGDRLPAFGPLTRDICPARTSRVLADLLGSGVGLRPAIELAACSARTPRIAGGLRTVHARVAAGHCLSDAMADAGAFPLMLTQMVAVGETSGAVPAALRKCAEMYEAHTAAEAIRLTRVLEPGIILCRGLLIGLVVGAMFMPLVNLIEVFP